jgi:hypothetical protein
VQADRDGRDNRPSRRSVCAPRYKLRRCRGGRDSIGFVEGGLHLLGHENADGDVLKLLRVVCGQDHDQVLPAPPQELADVDPAMQKEHRTQSSKRRTMLDPQTDEFAQLISWWAAVPLRPASHACGFDHLDKAACDCVPSPEQSGRLARGWGG